MNVTLMYIYILESVMSWGWVHINKAVVFTEECLIMSEMPVLMPVHVVLSMG